MDSDLRTVETALIHKIYIIRLFEIASLSVDAVLHEGDWPGVAPLVGGGAHRGRLHDDVVDDAPGHQEVGEQHHEQHLIIIWAKQLSLSR